MKEISNKRRRLYIGLLVGILLVIDSVYTYMTKPLTLDDVKKDKPNFSGTVIEVNDDHTILVKPDENEPVMKSSDKIRVSLDVKMKGIGQETFDIGYEIRVYYDGAILESYPAQINEVYVILLKKQP